MYSFVVTAVAVVVFVVIVVVGKVVFTVRKDKCQCVGGDSYVLAAFI